MGRKAMAKKRVRQEVSIIGKDGQFSRQHWILIETMSGQEKLARKELRDEGFEVYLPMRLGARIDGTMAVLPFFPRFLFARITVDVERWQTLFGLRGVRRVMGASGKPTGFRDEFVDGIKALEVEGYLRLGLVPAPPACGWKAGEDVVVDGLLPGLFVGVDGRRVDVLLSILSSDSRVTVDISRVALGAGDITKGDALRP